MLICRTSEWPILLTIFEILQILKSKYLKIYYINSPKNKKHAQATHLPLCGNQPANYSPKHSESVPLIYQYTMVNRRVYEPGCPFVPGPTGHNGQPVALCPTRHVPISGGVPVVHRWCLFSFGENATSSAEGRTMAPIFAALRVRVSVSFSVNGTWWLYEKVSGLVLVGGLYFRDVGWSGLFWGLLWSRYMLNYYLKQIFYARFKFCYF